MDTQTGAIRPIAAGGTPTPTELELTAEEAEVLGRYKADYRPELLRRWRAGVLVLGSNGLLRDPVFPPRTKEQRRIGQILDHYAERKARQHRKAVAAAARRKGRRH